MHAGTVTPELRPRQRGQGVDTVIGFIIGGSEEFIMSARWCNVGI